MNKNLRAVSCIAALCLLVAWFDLCDAKLVVEHYRPIFNIKRRDHDKVLSALMKFEQDSTRRVLLDTGLDEIFDTMALRLNEVLSFEPTTSVEENMWTALPLDAAGGLWELTALLSDLVVVTHETEGAALISSNDTRVAVLQAATRFAQSCQFYDLKHKVLIRKMTEETDVFRIVEPLPPPEHSSGESDAGGDQAMQQKDDDKKESAGEEVKGKVVEGSSWEEDRKEFEQQVIAELEAQKNAVLPGDKFRDLEVQERLIEVAKRIRVAEFDEERAKKVAKKSSSKWVRRKGADEL